MPCCHRQVICSFRSADHPRLSVQQNIRPQLSSWMSGTSDERLTPASPIPARGTSPPCLHVQSSCCQGRSTLFQCRMVRRVGGCMLKNPATQECVSFPFRLRSLLRDNIQRALITLTEEPLSSQMWEGFDAHSSSSDTLKSTSWDRRLLNTTSLFSGQSGPVKFLQLPWTKTRHLIYSRRTAITTATLACTERSASV